MSDIRDPNYVPTLAEALADPAGFVEGMTEVKIESLAPIKSRDRFTDPECQNLLADLRAIEARAQKLAARLDRGGVVGILWGVCHGLAAAIHAAERELLQLLPETE